MPARIATYKGTASPLGQNGVAAANTNLYSIFNKSGSGVLVAVRDITVRTNQSGDSATVRTPKLSRITTAPTTGTIVPKVAFDSSLTSSASVEARGGPASADYGASVTLTATPGSTAGRTFGVRRTTGVGQFLPGGIDFAPLGDLAVDPIVLVEGEGLLLTVVESGTTGMQYVVNCVFEEFTYAAGGDTVSPALLGGYALFAPTAQPGNVNVSPALLGGGSLFTPAFRLQVTPPLIGPSGQVITPFPFQFILHAAPILAVGVVFPPSLAMRVEVPRVGGIFEGFDPGGFDPGGSLIFAPEVVRPVEIPLLGGSSLFSPTVARANEPQTVTIPFLSRLGGFADDAFDPAAFNAGGLYTPVISQTIVVSPSLLGGSTLFSPSVIPNQVVLAGLIDRTLVSFAPVLSASGVQVRPDLLGGYVLYAPGNLPGGISLAPNRIDQSGIVFAPTVTAGALTVQAPLIDHTAIAIDLFGVMAGGVWVLPGILGPPGLAFAPQVNLTGFVPPLIQQLGVVFDPSMSGGLVIITGTVPIATGANLDPSAGNGTSHQPPVGVGSNLDPQHD